MKEIMTINKECVSNRILITRIIFLKLLALISFLSFISLYNQIQGLWGNSGILPTNLFLSKIKNNTWHNHLISYPSIAWFFNLDKNSYQIENLLYILCLLGIIISLLIIFQYSLFFNAMGFSFLWYIHYNFYFLGQNFMRFSWDELLLEIGFISIFFAPLNINGNTIINHITHINNISFYILKFILLKFMISTGINIISSKCDYWNSFNGLNYFFEGQPLLSSYSFFFHTYLNSKTKKLISAFGYFCLIYLPFGYFLVWRRFSIYAGQITFFFNLFFIFAGNYGYLHFLIIVLNILNFDDYYFRTIFSNKFLINFKLDYLSPLIPLYIKQMKERKKILMKKENKIIEIKKELDTEKEKENNKIKILNLKKKYYKAKKEVINMVENDYIEGPKIESTLKVESSIKNELFIFINFFCINLIVVYIIFYPINNLLSERITINKKSSSQYKTIILIFSILIYLYIMSTIILNFTNKIKNYVLLDKNFFSSFLTDIIMDKKNKKINKGNEFEQSSEDENENEDENEVEIDENIYEERKKNRKFEFLNVFLFTLNIMKYFSIIIIFTIYYIGSVKYFLLNMDIKIINEKIRNSNIANHLEKTNYGLYKFILSLSDNIFGNYYVYGIYGNIQKEILNILGRSEIEIEYLYRENNKTWNDINFKYKLGKNYTNPKFLFFHTPRLDFKMFEVAYNEDINEEPWMASLIGKIFDKNPVVLDLLNYNCEEKNFLKKISMFEKLKQIYLGKQKSIINDNIDKIRIDIFKYKFINNNSFKRKRYKEYLAQLEKYAIMLINEKLGNKVNAHKKIEFTKFQFIPIIDIVIIFILINIFFTGKKY